MIQFTREQVNRTTNFDFRKPVVEGRQPAVVIDADEWQGPDGLRIRVYLGVRGPQGGAQVTWFVTPEGDDLRTLFEVFRPDLLAVERGEFDPPSIIGKYCIVTLKHGKQVDERTGQPKVFVNGVEPYVPPAKQQPPASPVAWQTPLQLAPAAAQANPFGPAPTQPLLQPVQPTLFKPTPISSADEIPF